MLQGTSELSVSSHNVVNLCELSLACEETLLGFAFLFVQLGQPLAARVSLTKFKDMLVSISILSCDSADLPEFFFKEQGDAYGH